MDLRIDLLFKNKTKPEQIPTSATNHRAGANYYKTIYRYKIPPFLLKT